MTNSDSAFRALQAADPTTGNPDTDAIRGLVRRPAPARPRGIRQLAAVAVVALGVGSAGGYQVAAQGAASASTEVAVSTADAAAQAAGPAKRASSSMAPDRMMAYGGRPWLTPASGLGDEPGSAVGYLASREGVDMAARVAQIAAAFGIDAKATKLDDGSFTLGDSTGAAATAGTGGDQDPMASWWFSNPTVSPYGCGGVVVYDKGAAGSSDPAAAPSCTPVSGTALGEDEALAQAQSLFTALGLPADGARWTVSGTEWFGTDAQGKAVPFRHVSAGVLVEGSPSGLEWSIDLGPNGEVAAASGFFATFAATAEYAVVGAATAALRSQDALWTSFGPYEQGSGVGVPMPAVDARVSSSGVSAVESSRRVRFDAEGRPLVAAALDKATITSAKLGLAQHYLADGRVALLPAWYLTGAERTWVQIAIADKYVDLGE